MINNRVPHLPIDRPSGGTPPRQTRPNLLTDRRGAVGLLAAMMLSILLGIGAWSLNEAHLQYRATLQRQTAQSAALAAAAKLSTYYTSGTQSTTDIVNAAQTIASANMPGATYGTVVPAANIVLGNWNAATSAFTSLATSGGVSPDAVKIITSSTGANGNGVATLFPGLVGRATVDFTNISVASYGTGQTFHTIMLNDLSGSFVPSVAQQRAADTGIMNCVRTASSSLSKFGLTGFSGSSHVVQPLVQASTNLALLTSKIATITGCYQSYEAPRAGMPMCGVGTNLASGLYSAIQQFSLPEYANTSKNVVIITDGVPEIPATPRTYVREDGTYATPTSPSPVCSTNCTTPNLWTMATNQAAAARAAGINVSTIYYSGSTPSGQRAAYQAQLATLRGGTGVSMVAPSSAAIASTFAGFCATMSSSLKAVY